MTDYRRYRLAGGTYFFTVNLAERNSRLLIDRIDLLRHAFREVGQAHPFTLDAAVVLPDHLHAVWTLPEGDSDFSLRWRQIKSAFSRGIELGERISRSRARKHERGLWQRRYWEHAIRDAEDLARHLDYVHFNPVKHGYVQRAVTGLIPFFTGTSGGEFIQPHGRRNRSTCRKGDDGFRCALPILPCYYIGSTINFICYPYGSNFAK
jgi:putative transposase